MAKLKTRSAAKKRFRKVGSSSAPKIKRAKAFRRHLLTRKSNKTKRQLRSGALVGPADIKRIAALLPY